VGFDNSIVKGDPHAQLSANKARITGFLNRLPVFSFEHS
jgi:hypothetical protein